MLAAQGRVRHRPAEGVNTGRRDAHAGGGRTGRAKVSGAGTADLRPGARADAGRVARQCGALAADGGIVARNGGGRVLMEGDGHFIGADRAGSVRHRPAEGVSRARISRKRGSRTANVAESAARAALDTPCPGADGGRVGGERDLGLAAGGAAGLVIARSGGGRIWGEGHHHVVGAGRAGRVRHCPAEGVNTGRRDAHAGGGRTGRAKVSGAGAADLRPGARADAGRVARQGGALAADGGIVACGGGRVLMEGDGHFVGAGRAGSVRHRPAEGVSRARISRKSGSRTAGVAEGATVAVLDAPHAVRPARCEFGTHRLRHRRAVAAAFSWSTASCRCWSAQVAVTVQVKVCTQRLTLSWPRSPRQSRPANR